MVERKSYNDPEYDLLYNRCIDQGVDDLDAPLIAAYWRGLSGSLDFGVKHQETIAWQAGHDIRKGVPEGNPDPVRRWLGGEVFQIGDLHFCGRRIRHKQFGVVAFQYERILYYSSRCLGLRFPERSVTMRHEIFARFGHIVSLLRNCDSELNVVNLLINLRQIYSSVLASRDLPWGQLPIAIDRTVDEGSLGLLRHYLSATFEAAVELGDDWSGTKLTRFQIASFEDGTFALSGMEDAMTLHLTLVNSKLHDLRS